MFLCVRVTPVRNTATVHRHAAVTPLRRLVIDSTSRPEALAVDLVEDDVVAAAVRYAAVGKP